jgi:nitrate/nitrite transport system substrate-binding protein
VGFKEVNKAAAAVKAVQGRKEVTFAMTFPEAHDIWLRNWLAAGINQKSVASSFATTNGNMRVDNMEDFVVNHGTE